MSDFFSRYRLIFITLAVLGLLYVVDSKLFLVNKGSQNKVSQQVELQINWLPVSLTDLQSPTSVKSNAFVQVEGQILKPSNYPAAMVFIMFDKIHKNKEALVRVGSLGDVNALGDGDSVIVQGTYFGSLAETHALGNVNLGDISGVPFIIAYTVHITEKGQGKPQKSAPTIIQNTPPPLAIPPPTPVPTPIYSSLPPTPMPLVSPSLPSDLRQYVHSVVELRCPNILNQSETINGSGVVIDGRGYILTNRHLVLGFNAAAGSLYAARNCDVYLTSTGDLYTPKLAYGATLVSALTDYDAAVFRIVKDANGNSIDSATGLQALDMSDNTSQTGNRVFTIGYPSASGYEFHITTGLVTGFSVIQNHEAIKTDALISPGNSGGALLDDQGHFIGIPTFGDPGISGGYAIEISGIKKWAQYVVQGTSNLSSEQIISRTVEMLANPF